MAAGGVIYAMYYAGNEFARDFRKNCLARIPASALESVAYQMTRECEDQLSRALAARRGLN
jgi:hypothetical protein